MISIIVPTTGKLHHIQRVVSSVLKQKISEEFELIVISNPHSPVLQEYIEKLPANFIFHSISQRGANLARNKGIVESKGRYLFFFDDDCEIIDPLFLQKRIDYFNTNAQIDVIGGPYHAYELKDPYSQAYFFLQMKWLLEGEQEDGYHQYLAGGNMSFRPEVFKNLGFFNDKIRFGGTETEFFLKHKMTIKFFKDQPVYHHYEMDFKDFVKKAFMQGIGNAYIKKNIVFNLATKYQYGKDYLQTTLNINKNIDKYLKIYNLAFESGFQFYTHKNNMQPKPSIIYFYVIKNIYFNSKHYKKYFLRLMSIIENYKYLAK